MKKSILLIFILLLSSNTFPQNNDSVVIQSIYSNALNSYESYNNLKYLSKNIGGRICGSKQAELAVEWVKSVLENYAFDNIRLMEIMVRNWDRGEEEIAKLYSGNGSSSDLKVCAIGTSIGTGINGLKGKVIEVNNMGELEKLDKESIKGRIVFYNRIANNTFFNTFDMYGDAVAPRVIGAIEAANYGAIAVIVRSVTLSNDDYPHTGIMRYVDSVKKIPAFSISTNGADFLSKEIRLNPDCEVFLRSTCEEHPEKISHNVIAEIKGAVNPEKIIVVSGHLDSWDNGEGAHDDGAGIMHSIEVLRIFKALNIIPNNTIRFVAFMDEEVAQRGGRKYAEIVEKTGEEHIIAIESDVGGSTPMGFSIYGNDTVIAKINSFKNLLVNYGLNYFEKGYSGVDISFLHRLGIPGIGLITDSQRYFDYHHSPNDTFEKVNRRELQLGSAAIASLVYLIDKYGLELP